MNVSGYSTKFLFEFNSLNGTYYRIRIQKKNYSGNVITRALGQAPVLKKENGENGIYGTSLEIYAECSTDGEFAELYTSSATEFYVTLGRVINNVEAVLWSGFISPELYAEPDIAPPYDVQIIATDGLGELKIHSYSKQGRKTLSEYLLYLLGQTGQTITASDILFASTLSAVSPSISAENLMSQVYLNMDFLDEGATCYDALEGILASFHFSITQLGNKWLLLRENDLSISNNLLSLRTAAGISATTPVYSFGSMVSHNWWPVGQLTKEVKPAKNTVTIVQPYGFFDSFIKNASLESTDYWNFTNAELVDNIGAELHHSTQSLAKGTIYQSIQQSHSVEEDGNALNLTISYGAVCTDDVEDLTDSVKFQLMVVTSDDTYFLAQNENGELYWHDGTATYISMNPNVKTGILTKDDLEDVSFNIPGLPDDGSLYFQIWNEATNDYPTFEVYVGGVYLTPSVIKGYKDIVNINNSARESLDEIEISLGDIPDDCVNEAITYINYLSSSSAFTSAWQTDKFANTADFIKIIALDYALSNALPRLNVKGKLNIPQNTDIPAIFSDGFLNYLTSLWTWDLLNDELAIEMLSAPAATMTITSQDHSIILNDEYQKTSIGSGSSFGGNSSGSGSGGSGGSYWRKFNYTESSIDKEGIEASYPISVVEAIFGTSGSSGRQKLFELVNIGTAQSPQWAIHTPLPLYSDQDISVGIPSGGGGGGTTLEAVWETLTNESAVTTYNSTRLHWKHIVYDNVSGNPQNGQIPVWDGSKFIWGNASSGTLTDFQFNGTSKVSGGVASLNTSDITSAIGLSSYLTIASAAATYQTIAQSSAESTIISAALQSLQSQIDSVASKTDFDEINASVLTSDIASITSGYFGTLYENGTSLSSKYLALTGGTITGALSISGALSALSLTLGSSTLTENILATLIAKKDMFEFENVGTSQSPVWVIKTTYPLYSTQDISVGSASSGGGGGGTTLPAVWQSLTTNGDEYANYRIHAGHIFPTLVNGKILSVVNGAIAWIDTPASGVTSIGGATGAITLGANLSISGGVLSATDTTYSDATTSVHGLMSVADKTKLNSIAFGTQGSDYVPVTIGSTTKNVLTAHQSLAGYVTTSNIGTYALTPTNFVAGTNYQAPISDLATIRNNASNGATAYGYFSGGKLPYTSLSGAPTSLSQFTDNLGSSPVHTHSQYLTSATATLTYKTIAQSSSDNTIISSCLQSLQSQIDSVATRTMFDELSASTIYSDIISASNFYGASLSATTATFSQGVNMATSSGNVGIGTTSPTYKLHVNGTANATTIYENGVALANKYLALVGGTLTGGLIGTTATFSGAVNLATTSGNVGIGTSSPSYKLTINSSGGDVIRISSAATYSCIYMGANSGANWSIGCNSNSAYYFWNSIAGSVVTSISSAGNISTVGSIYSAIDVSCASDIRLKTNITKLPNVMSAIGWLDLFYHDWVDKRSGLTIGLSAQQLLDSPFSCLVHQNNDGYYSVAYEKLTVVALKGLQEHESEINDLKARVSYLENKLRQNNIEA